MEQIMFCKSLNGKSQLVLKTSARKTIMAGMEPAAVADWSILETSETGIGRNEST